MADIKLSSGCEIDAHRGILGLTFHAADRPDYPDEAVTLFGGYDDTVGEAEHFAPAERREVATRMVERWRQWGGLALRDEALAELELLEREATPAPWASMEDEKSSGCWPGVKAGDVEVIVWGHDEGGIVHKRDAEIIPKMRNAMPLLLAEVRQARERTGGGVPQEVVTAHANAMKALARELAQALNKMASQNPSSDDMQVIGTVDALLAKARAVGLLK